MDADIHRHIVPDSISHSSNSLRNGTAFLGWLFSYYRCGNIHWQQPSLKHGHHRNIYWNGDGCILLPYHTNHTSMLPRQLVCFQCLFFVLIPPLVIQSLYFITTIITADKTLITYARHYTCIRTDTPTPFT